MNHEIVSKRAVNLYSRLNRLPITKTAIIQVIFLTLVCVVESFAIGIIASTIVILQGLWSLDASQIGMLSTASTAGIVIGLICSGRLIDKYGRKRVIIWGVSIFTLFTLLAPVSNHAILLSLMRFIAGLGEGAVFAIPFVMISELVSSKKRSIVSGLVIASMSVSYSIPNLVGSWARNTFEPELAWRIPFIIGGSFIILVPILVKYLHESPRWLITNYRYADAEAIVLKLEAEAGIKPDDTYINHDIYQAEMKPKVKGSIVSLFKQPYLKRTITSFSPFVGNMVILYTLQVYGPVIFTQKGFTESEALFYTGLLQLWVVFGNLLQGYLGDRIGRKPTIFLYSTGAAAGLIIFLYAGSSLLLVLGAMIAWFFGIGSPILKTYIGEQYPTHLRATGNAFGEATGRFLGGVVLAYFVPFILVFGGVDFLFWLTAILLIGLSTPMFIFGQETAGRSVEQSGAIDSEDFVGTKLASTFKNTK